MNRALGMLGLAMKAGKVICGEAQCDKLIKSGQARLVLIDSGISAASKKALTDACAYYHTAMRAVPEGELGRATGRSGRMAAAITDESFAARLNGLLDNDVSEN